MLGTPGSAAQDHRETLSEQGILAQVGEDGVEVSRTKVVGGIEALSRGAEHATFVDDAPQAVAAVRENLRRTGFEDRDVAKSADPS